MNVKMIVRTLRKLLMIEGLIMFIPLIVALIYGENILPFLIPAVVLTLIGFIGNKSEKIDQTIYGKDGIIIVGLVWLLWSLFGALPFVISGEIPNYIDAFFEMVSGFTTTGGSICTNVEALSHGALFWRSFSHLIGGIGVLVFVLAVVPLAEGRSMFLMKAEMPGPSVDKLVPKTKKTALILCTIYLALTAILIVFLWAGGMPLFDSLIHAFGTAGTGGFSMKAASIGAYQSAYFEIVITVFMALFGVNFTIYYLLLTKKISRALHNTELWTYIGVFVVASLVIAFNILNMTSGFGEALRQSTFQVSSIMTTTGYSSTDFALWPNLSQGIILLLMMMGACAGSTGGGFKVIRVVLLGKILRHDLNTAVHPRRISTIRLDGAPVDDEVISGVKTYTLMYLAIMVVGSIVVAFDGFDITTTLSSVISCLNNIGPALGNVAGPMGSFAGFSWLSKLVLSLCMLMGRLEIFPILMILKPSLWRKKSL